MPIANTSIIPLTTDNNISDVMLKINELVYELNTFYDKEFDFEPTSANTVGWLEGRVFYDESEHALSYFNDDPNIIVNVGDAIIRVKNDKDFNISVGQAVYIDGVVDKIPTVNLALSNTSITSSIIIGVSTANITANSTGYMTLGGKVSGFDTSDFITGDVLYLSDTEAGSFTNIKPINKTSIKLGLVTYSDANNGIVLVNTGSESSSMESYFTFNNPQLDDIIIHDGSNFTNDSKLNLTNGGNF